MHQISSVRSLPSARWSRTREIMEPPIRATPSWMGGRMSAAATSAAVTPDCACARVTMDLHCRGAKSNEAQPSG